MESAVMKFIEVQSSSHFILHQIPPVVIQCSPTVSGNVYIRPQVSSITESAFNYTEWSIIRFYNCMRGERIPHGYGRASGLECTEQQYIWDTEASKASEAAIASLLTSLAPGACALAFLLREL